MEEERGIGWCWYSYLLFSNAIFITSLIKRMNAWNNYLCLIFPSQCNAHLSSSTFWNVCVYDTLKGNKFEERDN